MCENKMIKFQFGNNRITLDLMTLLSHVFFFYFGSEYFKTILKQTNKRSEPMICLDGVNSKDLQNVLDYVYLGEVKIHQDDLDRFLSTAQKLKLNGLMSNNDDQDDYDYNNETANSIDNESNLSENAKDIIQFNDTKRNITSKRTTNEKFIAFVDNGRLSEEEHNQRLLENIKVNDDRTVSCNICGKTFEKKFNAKRHVEVHINGLVYSCSQCDKTYTAKTSLTDHIYKHHKGR